MASVPAAAPATPPDTGASIHAPFVIADCQRFASERAWETESVE